MQPYFIMCNLNLNYNLDVHNLQLAIKRYCYHLKYPTELQESLVRLFLFHLDYSEVYCWLDLCEFGTTFKYSTTHY